MNLIDFCFLIYLVIAGIFCAFFLYHDIFESGKWGYFLSVVFAFLWPLGVYFTLKEALVGFLKKRGSK